MNPLKRLWAARQQKKEVGKAMKDFSDKAYAFAQENPDTLIILGDPHTDVILMTYKGVVAPVRILNRDHSRNYIVRNALKHKKSDGDIDRFLLAVDGGLYSIAETLYSQQRAKFSGKVLSWVGKDAPPAASAVTLADGSVVSPIQVVDSDGKAL